MKQNTQHIYLLSLLLALKVLQTTNTQQLSSVTNTLNHCNCHWVAGGALNRGQSRRKSMYMGINLNAVQKFSAYHFI